jgi:hypothetical protein
VHAEFTIGEVALHGGGEPVEVVAVLDERGDVGVLAEARGGGLGDVALKTAGIVAETGEFGVAGLREDDRTQIYCPAISESVTSPEYPDL